MSIHKSITDLSVELCGLRELMLSEIKATNKTMDERDKLYTERDKASSTALNAALQAAQTLNSTIFASSEKAISVAESNSEKWRTNANEWRAAMMDREAKFSMKTEVLGDVKALDGRLKSLEESRALGGGAQVGEKRVKDEGRANISIIIAVITFLLFVSSKLIDFTK